MKTIKLTEEQFIELVDLLDKEWDDELLFQQESYEPDTSYLKTYFDLYQALYKKTKGIVEALMYASKLEEKKKELDELIIKEKKKEKEN